MVNWNERVLTEERIRHLRYPERGVRAEQLYCVLPPPADDATDDQVRAGVQDWVGDCGQVVGRKRAGAPAQDLALKISDHNRSA